MQALSVSVSAQIPTLNVSIAKPPVDLTIPRERAGKTLDEGFRRLGLETTIALIERGIPAELLHGVTSWMAVLDPFRRECLALLDGCHGRLSNPVVRHREEFDRASSLLAEVREKWSKAPNVCDADLVAMDSIRTEYETAAAQGGALSHLVMAIARMRHFVAWPPEPVHGADVADDLSTLAGQLESSTLTPMDVRLPRQVLILVCQKVGSLAFDTSREWLTRHFAVATSLFVHAATPDELADLVRQLAVVVRQQVLRSELNRFLTGAMQLTVFGEVGAGASQRSASLSRALDALILRWRRELPQADLLKEVADELIHDDGSVRYKGFRLLLAAQRIAHAMAGDLNFQHPGSRDEAADALQRYVDGLATQEYRPGSLEELKAGYLGDIATALARLSLAEERRMHRHLAYIVPTIVDAADVQELQSIGTQLASELRRAWLTKKPG